MFTGIVEETGTLRSLSRGQKSCVIRIQCSTVLEDTKIGDSIAVNGICLTVTDMDSGGFAADVMNETLSRSSLGQTRPGDPVTMRCGTRWKHRRRSSGTWWRKAPSPSTGSA